MEQFSIFRQFIVTCIVSVARYDSVRFEPELQPKSILFIFLLETDRTTRNVVIFDFIFYHSQCLILKYASPVVVNAIYSAQFSTLRRFQRFESSSTVSKVSTSVTVTVLLQNYQLLLLCHTVFIRTHLYLTSGINTTSSSQTWKLFKVM